MRALFLTAAVGLAALPAAAQTFRLVNPALTVDGRRIGVAGAPLVQEPFGLLALAVPGVGTYRVSDRPFDGSRSVGQFDGDGLYFALDGRSVRLRSAGPILDRRGAAPAHVRLDPGPSAPARGLARVTLVDSRGPIADASVRRGPTAASRPAPDPRDDARTLRDALARATAERTALAAERDRLRAERDAARDRAAQPGWTAARDGAYGDAVARAEALDAEAARLRAERDQLVATRDRAADERARLAADLDDARRRAEAAEARGLASQARAADDEVSRLRADIVARDQALAALRVESDDRRVRLAETDAELGRTQRALVAMTAERDRAVVQRDAALAERDAARRDRTGTADLAAARASLDADRALLAEARARFEADRAAAALNPATVSPDDAARLAERQQALDALAGVQAERDVLSLQVAALQSERDRLRTTVDRLTSDLAAERGVSQRLRDEAARPSRRRGAPAPPAPVPAPEPVARRVRSVASFPGFDFARLANPDVVRRRVDEAEYPQWAAEGDIEGDVLVLFQTDATGRVIRTAVPAPIGGGLDALAESLVRDMQFVPPVVDGQRSGLRSQVLVRFEN